MGENKTEEARQGEDETMKAEETDKRGTTQRRRVEPGEEEEVEEESEEEEKKPRGRRGERNRRGKRSLQTERECRFRSSKDGVVKEKGQGEGRQETRRVGEGGREEASQRGEIQEICRRNDGQPEGKTKRWFGTNEARKQQ